MLNRAEVQWQHLLRKAFIVEDQQKCKQRTDRRFVPTYSEPYTGRFTTLQPKLKWYWECLLRPYVYLFGGITFSLMSVAVIWSEVLFWKVDPTLSLFAWLVQKAGRDAHYFSVEVFTFITILYLSVSAYRVIFKIRVFNFYYLVPHKQSDSSRFVGRCVSVFVTVCL